MCTAMSPNSTMPPQPHPRMPISLGVILISPDSHPRAHSRFGEPGPASEASQDASPNFQLPSQSTQTTNVKTSSKVHPAFQRCVTLAGGPIFAGTPARFGPQASTNLRRHVSSHPRNPRKQNALATSAGINPASTRCVTHAVVAPRIEFPAPPPKPLQAVSLCAIMISSLEVSF